VQVTPAERDFLSRGTRRAARPLALGASPQVRQSVRRTTSLAHGGMRMLMRAARRERPGKGRFLFFFRVFYMRLWKSLEAGSQVLREYTIAERSSFRAPAGRARDLRCILSNCAG
jgi:hypothetical protein